MKKIFLLLGIICTLVSANNLPDYSRVLDLERTIITFKDLKEMISIIKDYDDQLGLDKKGSLEVRVSTGKDEISFYSFEQIEKMDLGNENYSNLEINYRSNYKSENEDISSLSINLGLSNRIRITGSDIKKVNSLSLVIKDFFESKKTFFSSKTPIFVFIFITYFLIMLYGTNKSLSKKDEEDIFMKKVFVLILLGIICLSPIMFLDKILPNFLLVPINKPWFEEYGGTLAFLTVVGFILTIWGVWPKKAK